MCIVVWCTQNVHQDSSGFTWLLMFDLLNVENQNVFLVFVVLVFIILP